MLKVQIDEIDFDYKLVRTEADEQLKTFLEQEDTNSDGLISDTYLRLSEI